MIEYPVLVGEWHPVLRSDGLAEGQVCGARLLGEDLVLWQMRGRVLAWQDLQAELHLRSDRLAIAYRRWLRELGLSFGTA